MDMRLAREMAQVIRNEWARRSALLEGQHPGYAYDQWTFTDEPFGNELAIVLLVAVRHQLERDLVHLAARRRTTTVEQQGEAEDHEARVCRARRDLRAKGGWARLIEDLQLSAHPAWDGEIKTLELLANCYKHEPSERPDEALLAHLQLPAKPYAPLPESDWFREGLALSIGLTQKADYCDIVEEMLARVERFLRAVEERLALPPVEWVPISLDPRDAEG